MSFIDTLINNVPPAQDRTEFNREVKGSGLTPLNIEKIDAGDFYLESFRRHPTLGNFVPLDFIRVSNSSNNTIILELNQDPNRAVPVESGMTDTIDLGKFHTLKIKNLGNEDIEAQELNISVMRKPRSRDDDFIERKETLQGFNQK